MGCSPFLGGVPQPWWGAGRSESRGALQVVASRATSHLAAGEPALSVQGGALGSGPTLAPGLHLLNCGQKILRRRRGRRTPRG